MQGPLCKKHLKPCQTFAPIFNMRLYWRLSLVLKHLGRSIKITQQFPENTLNPKPRKGNCYLGDSKLLKFTSTLADSSSFLENKAPRDHHHTCRLEILHLRYQTKACKLGFRLSTKEAEQHSWHLGLLGTYLRLRWDVYTSIPGHKLRVKTNLKSGWSSGDGVLG